MKLHHHHLRCHLGKNDQDKLTMQTTSKVKGVDIGVVGIMAEDMEANMEEVITEEEEGVTMGVEEEIRIEELFRMLDGKRIIKPKIKNAMLIQFVSTFKKIMSLTEMNPRRKIIMKIAHILEYVL